MTARVAPSIGMELQRLLGGGYRTPRKIWTLHAAQQQPACNLLLRLVRNWRLRQQLQLVLRFRIVQSVQQRRKILERHSPKWVKDFRVEMAEEFLKLAATRDS